MDLNKKNTDRQKITLALYFIKKNENPELFGKWGIYIGKKYIIGRKNSDINIDHPLISRNHLELIFYTNNLINIRDLGSRNGTYINNAKVNPYQEIKFCSKDKLSLGDINNKILFMENQETKKSIFEDKINNENNDNNEQKISQETKKITSHNYDKRRNLYNKYGQGPMRPRRGYRYRYRYRFRPHSYHKNIFVPRQKTREIYSDNNSLPSKEFKSLEINEGGRNNQVNNYSNRNLKNEELKKDNKNEFIGKKIERNKSQSKNSDKMKKKKDLEKLIQNKKIGLEKLKKKLKSIENDSEEEYDYEEEEEEGLEIFDLENNKGSKKQKIIFKTDKLNDLEFEVPVNERKLKDLKNVKKIKYLVNGYLVLNVKEKKFVYE